MDQRGFVITDGKGGYETVSAGIWEKQHRIKEEAKSLVPQEVVKVNRTDDLLITRVKELIAKDEYKNADGIKLIQFALSTLDLAGIGNDKTNVDRIGCYGTDGELMQKTVQSIIEFAQNEINEKTASKLASEFREKGLEINYIPE